MKIIESCKMSSLLDPMTGTISGQPTEKQAVAPYELTVRDMKRATVAATIELEVKGS